MFGLGIKDGVIEKKAQAIKERKNRWQF